MYSKVFGVLAFVAVAYSHDIVQGNNATEARNVFEGHFQASPAIWKQTKDLFINASEHEVISNINITDLRPDKDGDAQITAGGVGHNNVTITLKSPTILRGYDFLVSVYSVFDQNGTVHESNFDSQPPQIVRVENREIPDEKISTEIPSDVTTGKTDVFTESGPTTVTGKPSEVPTKPTEVTVSTTILEEVSTPNTKDLSEPDVSETLGEVPEETPVYVEEQEPKKVQPFVGFHTPQRATTEIY